MQNTATFTFTLTLTPAQQLLLCTVESQYKSVTNEFYNSVMQNAQLTPQKQNELTSYIFQYSVAHALIPIFNACKYKLPTTETIAFNVQLTAAQLVAVTTLLAQCRAQHAQKLIKAYTITGLAPFHTAQFIFYIQQIDSILAQLQ